jgi:hypothetical protein
VLVVGEFDESAPPCRHLRLGGRPCCLRVAGLQLDLGV